MSIPYMLDFEDKQKHADFHKNIKNPEFVLGYHLGGLERNGLDGVEDSR